MNTRFALALLTAGILAPALPVASQSDDTIIARPEVVAQTTPSGIMTVIAGTGYFGNYGIPGPALSADLNMPQGLAVDAKGNIYVSEPENQVVYKIAAGKIAVFAGDGVGGYSGDGGAATKARLNLPYGLALDSAGNLYIADQRNDRIRMVNAKTGKISTVAGNGVGEGPAFGETCHIPVDGIAATKSSLCGPAGVAVDGSGNIYIADAEDNEIRLVTAKTGLISTVAGSYGRVSYAGDGSLAVNASLNRPASIALDARDDLFIADQSNCAVREVVASTKIISSLVGAPGRSCPGGVSNNGTAASSAVIGPPHAIAVDASGNVYFTDYVYGLVYQLNAANQTLYTIAGINLTGPSLYLNPGPDFTLSTGPGTYEFLYATSGIAFDNNKASATYGDVLFSDNLDGLVYKIAEPSAPQTDVPSISPAFPLATGPTTVSISAPVAGSKIYYTTNGKIPTTASTLYSRPFKVSGSAVVTAFAVKSGKPNSQAAIDVVIANPAPSFSATGVDGPGSTIPVTMTVPVTGGAIYYTTDGSDPRAMGPTVQKYTKTITAKYLETINAAYLPAAVADFGGTVWQQWSALTTATYDIQLP